LADQIMLVSISGQDKPGLMSALMGICVEYDAQILDMGQAVIHDELALGLLLSSANLDAMSAAIEARCEQTGSALRMQRVNADDYGAWSQTIFQSPLILTLLTNGSAAQPLQAVSALTHTFRMNIDTVRRLTKPKALAGSADTDDRFGLEMRLSGELASSVEFQAELLKLADHSGFDVSLQRDSVFRRNRRLVAFDMDSTLIAEEVMDELAKRHGVGAEVVAITDAAMAGELDFKESFRRRAALLRGMPLEVLHDVAESVALNTGAHRLIKALKHFGYTIAVFSGGFQYVGEHLQQRLGIDYVYANELEVVDGLMTGEVLGDIVDAQGKADLLQKIAAKEGISLAQTIAVGDGANDLPMLQQAGLGVAYHAKTIVRESAKHSISNFGLDAILYLIGFSDLDVEQALTSDP
jgi:phosphoserine phosphatase